MARLTRAARGAVVAVVLALIVAAPTAAAQPTRTVTDWPLVSHYPAGTGCEFDVTVYRTPGSRYTITSFSDGRQAFDSHAVHRTITNDATGATFVESSIFHEVDWFDADAGLIRGVVAGQFIWQFYPGDVGPDGVVLDHLLAVSIAGTATYVVDANTFATLEITIKGTVTDICAAIS